MNRNRNFDAITYPGGKGGVYQHIINLMPPHSRYIESHLGAGAVMQRKRPAGVNIGIDVDEHVIARWQETDRQDLTVIHGDALSVLPTLDLRRDDLLYCDPPYVPSQRRRRRVYRHDYSDADHQRLLAALELLPCRVILSGYDSPLYQKVLRHWHRTDFPARTHAGLAVESAWTNYKPCDVLHDYSYVGFDFRERERLRRRIHSLSRRLQFAEPMERNAVLASLCDSHPEAVAAAARRLR